jgi:hypothetical protein
MALSKETFHNFEEGARAHISADSLNVWNIDGPDSSPPSHRVKGYNSNLYPHGAPIVKIND